MVTFTYAGKSFKLEFARKKETVEVVRQNKSVGGRRETKVKQITSKYPYTQVTLCEVHNGVEMPEQYTVVEKAKVGCAPKDIYSHALGRLQALRVLSTTIRYQLRDQKVYQRGLVRAMWGAYENRSNVVAKPVQEELEPQQQGTAA